MKLTSKQLKQIIKEELENVLDEGLGDVDPDSWFEFYNGCMGQGVPQFDIEAGDKDRCMDVAMQIQSGNYDDDVVMAYMKDEYGGKKIAAPQKSETEDIDDWINNNRQWNEFYEYASDPKVWSWHFGDEPSPKELMRLYKNIFGELYQGIDPEEASWPGRKLKNKVVKWMKKDT
jgi:hypothetical protein